jgi:EAL domain-containing protein (putative c-di-GMP-specific phosphodiesterase class I)
VTTRKKAPPKAKDDREAGSSNAQRMQDLIDGMRFAMHFQPIVDLRSHKVFANEALCRPDRDFFNSPVELIEAAVETDTIGELGRLQRAFAVKNCSESALFLNLDPHEFDRPFLVRPDDPIFVHRNPVYLEITENVPLKYFDQCHSVLAELRKKGNFLVIDDFGAGFSNLKYIADLQPDVVKLDRELVRECRIGTSEFSLLTSISGLCHQMNARVVAEGIETVEELEAVVAAGVDFGQGYLFAKPAPEPPDIIWPVLPVGAATRPRTNEKPADTPPVSATTAAAAATSNAKEASQAAYLQAEIKKLTDLLVQSEVARLSLVRRLKDKPGTESTASAAQEPPRVENPPPVPAEPVRGESPLEQVQTDAWRIRDPHELDPVVTFSTQKIRRKISPIALALPALAVLILFIWIFWPFGGEQAVIASTPGASVGETVATTPPLAAAEGRAADSSAANTEATALGGSEQAARPATATPKTQKSSGAESQTANQPEAGPVSADLAAVAQSAETPAEAAPQAEDPPATTSPTSQVAIRIDEWAKAWSEKRANDYLTFYSVSFQTPSGESFGKWADDRRYRIGRPDWIKVDVSSLVVRFPSQDRAIARFKQAYDAPGYSDRVLKTQVWVFEYGNWHILAESSEPTS